MLTSELGSKPRMVVEDLSQIKFNQETLSQIKSILFKKNSTNYCCANNQDDTTNTKRVKIYSNAMKMYKIGSPQSLAFLN